MYYEPTMTPPPPKIIFPTAETEPPSTPYPTDLQSPQITIRFEPELTIQITTQQQNNVEKLYPKTPSVITITVTTTPINIVEKPFHQKEQIQTIKITTKTPTPFKNVETPSPLSPPNNKHATPNDPVETINPNNKNETPVPTVETQKISIKLHQTRPRLHCHQHLYRGTLLHQTYYRPHSQKRQLRPSNQLP